MKSDTRVGRIASSMRTRNLLAIAQVYAGDTRVCHSVPREGQPLCNACTGRTLALIRFETRQQVFLEVRRLIDPEHVVDAQEILCESMKQWHQVAALAHDLRG